MIYFIIKLTKFKYRKQFYKVLGKSRTQASNVKYLHKKIELIYPLTSIEIFYCELKFYQQNYAISCNKMNVGIEKNVRTLFLHEFLV